MVALMKDKGHDEPYDLNSIMSNGNALFFQSVLSQHHHLCVCVFPSLPLPETTIFYTQIVYTYISICYRYVHKLLWHCDLYFKVGNLSFVAGLASARSSNYIHYKLEKNMWFRQSFPEETSPFVVSVIKHHPGSQFTKLSPSRSQIWEGVHKTSFLGDRFMKLTSRGQLCETNFLGCSCTGMTCRGSVLQI